MIAKSYAPELQLVGVAAAAPATDLTALMTDDLNTAGGRTYGDDDVVMGQGFRRSDTMKSSNRWRCRPSMRSPTSASKEPSTLTGGRCPPR